MSQSDRTFVLLLASAAAVGTILALPLALTLLPAAIQQSFHASESVLRTCVAAVYAIGRDLPPLGLIVLALALGSIAGTVISAVRLVQRTERATRRSTVAAPAALRDAADRVGISGHLRVFADDIPLAYTAGLLRPQIWTSTSLARGLTADELDAVLWHEREHLLRRDPLRVLIVRVISSLFVIVPLVRVAALRFEVAKELDADRAAVRAQCGPAALAGALMVLGARHASADLAIGAWSMTNVRVDQLCGEDPSSLLPRSSRRVRALSATALAFALLLTFGQAARANVLPASLMDMSGGKIDGSMVHTCPLPTDGPLF